MKLQFKILLIIISTMTGVSLSLWLVSQTVLMSGFTKVETDNGIMNVHRVQDAINESIDNITTKATDWAKWDDTYQFAIDKNKDYIGSNLTSDVLKDIKLDIMVFFNNSKELIYSLQYNTTDKLAGPISQDIYTALVQNPTLIKHTSNDAVVTGFYMIKGSPLIIVSRPILTSTGKGPIHGTIIFGKFLNENELNHLQKITHLSITIEPFDKIKWRNLNDSHSTISPDSSILVRALNKNIIIGYQTIKDVNHNPVLMACITMPRDIYKQGQRTTIYLIVSIFFAGTILSIAIFALLKSMVILRIAKLNSDVNSICKTPDNSARVYISGSDELSDFAQSVNCMLASLQAKEMMIQNKNNEMRLLMNSIPVGLLSINEHFLINPEYSHSIEKILEKTNISGKNFLSVMGFNKADRSGFQSVIDFLELIQQNMINENEIAELNPYEEFYYNHNKWLQIRYFPIDRENNLPRHILVAIENISERKELAERVSKSEQENLQLKIIAEDPDLFRELLSEMKQLLFHAQQSLCKQSIQPITSSDIACTFRDVHTIKGTASSFGLDSIVEISGALEKKLSDLKQHDQFDQDTILQITNKLSLLQIQVDELVDKIKTIFGEQFFENQDITLHIPLERINCQYHSLINTIQIMGECQTCYETLHEAIRKIFIEFRTVTAKRGLAKAFRAIPSVIKKLQKNVRYTIKGEDTLLDCEVARELNTPMIHLIRNCIDHGIEPTGEERIIAGKDPQGHLYITIENRIDQIIVEISDDGRGLDLVKIKNTAIKRGFISEEKASTLTYDETVALIMLPGFSTADNVSEISGRGIGMDAVKASVSEKLHGSISINSETGKGTSFRLEIPMPLDMLSKDLKKFFAS